MQTFLICTVIISDMSHYNSQPVHWGPGYPTPVHLAFYYWTLKYLRTLHFALHMYERVLLLWRYAAPVSV